MSAGDMKARVLRELQKRQVVTYTEYKTSSDSDLEALGYVSDIDVVFGVNNASCIPSLRDVVSDLEGDHHYNVERNFYTTRGDVEVYRVTVSI